MKYWTLSNIPLFVLALPIVTILLASCRWAWTAPSLPPNQEVQIQSATEPKKATNLQGSSIFLRQVAVPQAILAILAVSNYHVQIITRLSSGYPLWYWWLAWRLTERDLVWSPHIVRWMVMYGTVQAGLFACFLPPA